MFQYKFLRIPLLSLNLCAVLCSGSVWANDSAHVSFDFSNVISTNPLVGANMTYKEGAASFLDGSYNLKPTLIAGGIGSGTQLVRFPGGTIVNTYRWKDAIGPQSSRIDQVHGWNTSSGSLSSAWGPDEAGQYAEAIGGELIVVISFNDTAQNAADLVEYMNAQVGDNPNGGTDWAAVRAANGHAAPYGVRYWEIGNESAGSQIKTWPNWPTSGDDNVNDGQDQSQERPMRRWAFGGDRDFLDQKAVRYSDWGETGPDPVSDGAIKTTGTASEMLYVKFPPVKRLNQVTVGTSLAGSVAWTEVPDLSTAGAGDQVFQLDALSGELLFGDGVHGAIPPSGSYVFVDYKSGNHDGYVDFYTGMKAVDPSIHIGASHFNMLSKYAGIVSAGADIDGYSAHAGDEAYAKPPAGADFLDQLLGTAHFGLNTTLGYSVTELTNRGLPAGTELLVSEYSTGKSWDSSLGLAQGKTVLGALAGAAAFRRTVTDFGTSTDYPVSVFQVNYLNTGGGGSMENNGVVTGAGVAQYLLTHYFGNQILGATDLVMPNRNLVWQGLKWQNSPQTESVPKVLMLGAKDVSGNFYVMAINTTASETMTVTVDLTNAFPIAGMPITSHTLLADSRTALNTFSNPDRIRIVSEAAPVDVLIQDQDTLSFPVDSLQIRVVKLEMPIQQEIQSIASGNWTNEATWSISGTPDFLDRVLLKYQHVVTIDSPANQLGNLRLDSGQAYLDIAAGGSLEVLNSGAYPINGAVSFKAAASPLGIRLQGGSLTAGGNFEFGAGGSGQTNLLSVAGASVLSLDSYTTLATVGSGYSLLDIDGSGASISVGGNMVLGSGAILHWVADASGVSPILSADTKNVTLDGALDIDLSSMTNHPAEIMLIENNGIGTLSGAFSSTSIVSSAGYELAVSGNDLVLTLTATPYEKWAAGYSLVGGSSGNDDGDALNNLAEYGMGGDPTNAADIGILPTFGSSGSVFECIYPRRSAPDSGLIYYLELTDDLVSGSWTNSGYTVVPETGYINDDFEAVTNEIPTLGKTNEFIRVRMMEK